MRRFFSNVLHKVTFNEEAVMKPISSVLLMSFVFSIGCQDTVQMTKEEFVGSGKRSAIVVQTRLSRRYAFRKDQYWFSGDSLTGIGVQQNRGPIMDTPFRGSLALSDITLIEAQEFNAGKTVLLAGGIGLAVAGIIALNNAGKESSPPPPPPPGNGTKFSCPFIYTFDGSAYHFESETFAGAVFKGLERTTVDRVSHLVPVRNICHLKLVNARDETEYVNEIKLIAIDHPNGTTVMADRIGAIHSISSPLSPSSCIGFDGKNALACVKEKDDSSWESDLTGRPCTDEKDTRDGLILEFPKPAGSRDVKLVVNGRNTRLGYFALAEVFRLKGADRLTWYQQLESDPAERARFARWITREGMLHVQVWKNNVWVEQTALPDVGPGISKDQVALLKLDGITDTILRVRLECTVDLWRIDQVYVDYSPDCPVQTTEVSPLSAINEQGEDVTGLLREPDEKYYTTVTGQFADIAFVDPPRIAGMQRSYAVRSRGFYYQWLSGEGAAQDRLVDRILSEPGFGTRALLPQWLKVRAQYEGPPHSPAATD